MFTSSFKDFYLVAAFLALSLQPSAATFPVEKKSGGGNPGKMSSAYPDNYDYLYQSRDKTTLGIKGGASSTYPRHQQGKKAYPGAIPATPPKRLPPPLSPNKRHEFSHESSHTHSSVHVGSAAHTAKESDDRVPKNHKESYSSLHIGKNSNSAAESDRSDEIFSHMHPHTNPKFPSTQKTLPEVNGMTKNNGKFKMGFEDDNEHLLDQQVFAADKELLPNLNSDTEQKENEAQKGALENEQSQKFIGQSETRQKQESGDVFTHQGGEFEGDGMVSGLDGDGHAGHAFAKEQDQQSVHSNSTTATNDLASREDDQQNQVGSQLHPAVEACDDLTCRGTILVSLLLVLVAGVIVGRNCCQRHGRLSPSESEVDKRPQKRFIKYKDIPTYEDQEVMTKLEVV
mmetsp:Transcript_16809/g.25409  ORF Transcript_16809/g.25409 Transcript_16809/m.25409 type:complete len:399 (+) Transcript_16809:118-1314(+)|eukprot:CAMPEP_0178904026 /NCGR_PEP_ID=MMETSP0786-20121207/5477_1 /TAXON_ID=186022 /ORGANISM="Thalassionema frauenfeldii, Strain CCMP 1798" /LENGTH=398 /DNA_ID=CAMNT_0020575449 /DNA_START=181 /DNA_END=1377 /DNA_ORIENTATION=+